MQVNENNADKNCNSFRFDESIKMAKRILEIYGMEIVYSENTCEYISVNS